jgi:hypothetical protein
MGRAQQTRSIFLDILNVFLLLSLFSGSRD